MAGAMRYKPSKPAGALSIIMGTVMLGFAITASSRGHKFPVGFLIFWCVMVVGVISLSARAAFFKNGSLAT
jgi:hypothetical protein